MPNQNFGEYFAGKGCTQTLYWGSAPHVEKVAPFNPKAIWNETDVRGTFGKRYGFFAEALKGDGTDSSQKGINPGLFSAGDMAGESVGSPGLIIPKLRELAQRVDNPLDLVSNATYEPSFQDAQDVLLVKHPTRNALVMWSTPIAELFQHATPAPSAPAPVIGPAPPVAPLPAPEPPTSARINAKTAGLLSLVIQIFLAHQAGQNDRELIKIYVPQLAFALGVDLGPWGALALDIGLAKAEGATNRQLANQFLQRILTALGIDLGPLGALLPAILAAVK